jgi:hypothetical protein
MPISHDIDAIARARDKCVATRAPTDRNVDATAARG